MQGCTVKHFVDCGRVMRFRRRLHGGLELQWRSILEKFNEIHLSDEDDMVYWGLAKNKVFSTKSMYDFLEKDLVGPDNRLIWNARLPLKIQIFMWQVFRNAIPTRDNMKKRKWPGAPVCSFCKT